MLHTAYLNVEKPGSILSRIISIAALVLCLSACGSETPAAHDSNQQLALSGMSDHEIALALYEDNRTPAGFYQEQLPLDVFYSTSHIRNTDLVPAAGRPGVAPYDLSSDDFSQVIDWSEQAASYQNVSRQLVDSEATTLYHELSRVDPATPGFVQRHRVFKASMLNRDGIGDTYKGRITKAAFDAADVKLIIEYLWTFTMDNNYGVAVLSSATHETATAYTHVMLQARLQSDYSGGCDTIELYEVQYEVPKATGNIWKQVSMLKAFSADQQSYAVTLCS